MPRKTSKKVVEAEVEVAIESPAPVETAPEAPAEVVESAEKQAFRAYIEDYKVRNPMKYAIKEAELLNKLNSL